LQREGGGSGAVSVIVAKSTPFRSDDKNVRKSRLDA
jgi:hypothetical protein